MYHIDEGNKDRERPLVSHNVMYSSSGCISECVGSGSGNGTSGVGVQVIIPVVVVPLLVVVVVSVVITLAMLLWWRQHSGL